MLSHFLSTEHLTAAQIHALLDAAEQWLDDQNQLLLPSWPLLKNKTIVNLFFENSTRTRCSFELAAQRLGAVVLNFDAARSSTKKGESLLDTVDYLQAMRTDLFVIRHEQELTPTEVAAHLGQRAAVINAGDGCHEHPTQAMLDMLTIRRHKVDFSQLKVVIIGDIAHSRVANSNIQALINLGVAELRLVGPPGLLPPPGKFNQVKLYQDLDAGLADADVVMALRIQRERMQQAAIPNVQEYFQQYGLTETRLKYARPNAMVMHPGPMNREVEIATTVADGRQSVIFQQATYGVAVRMAIMAQCLDLL